MSQWAWLMAAGIDYDEENEGGDARHTDVAMHSVFKRSRSQRQ